MRLGDGPYGHVRVQNRMVGAAVREARLLCGLNGDQLAGLLGWSPAKVSRVESGARACSAEDLARCLGMVGAAPDVFERAVHVHRQVDSDVLVHRHAPGWPDAVWTLGRCESSASVIVAYEPSRVPALLQTEAYARAVIGDDDPVQVEARMARQRRMYERSGLALEVLVPEAVLRVVVGGRAAMEEQLMQLLLLSHRDEFDIRVVSAPGVLLGGPFTLMEHRAYPPVVHVELEAASVLLDAPEIVRAYRARLRRLRAAAVGRQRSREVLLEIADGYGVRAVERIGAPESA
ncbi:helix-turn-helix domain-containing protein [Actinosynnema sp. CS-041913]|uniref:helix-turn-helix domain-containing protein n=1 Tax=Actinosynnema sp. CS-041913 TaxID=3239917 RepID=UPI003D9338D4